MLLSFFVFEDSAVSAVASWDRCWCRVCSWCCKAWSCCSSARPSSKRTTFSTLSLKSTKHQHSNIVKIYQNIQLLFLQDTSKWKMKNENLKKVCFDVCFQTRNGSLAPRCGDVSRCFWGCLVSRFRIRISINRFSAVRGSSWYFFCFIFQKKEGGWSGWGWQVRKGKSLKSF